MNKLMAAFRYQLSLSVSYFISYYTALHIFRFSIFILTYIGNGRIDGALILVSEYGSIISFVLFGLICFHEFFKVLLQNGYTRKIIFKSTLIIFALFSAITSWHDTILTETFRGYSIFSKTFFSARYGFNYSFTTKWIWLFTVYFLFISFVYALMIMYYNVGEKKSTGILISFLIITFLIIVILPDDAKSVLSFTIPFLFGRLKDGSINFILPFTTFISIASLFNLASYYTLSKTELKA